MLHSNEIIKPLYHYKGGIYYGKRINYGHFIIDCFITKFKKEDSSEWFESRYPDGGYIQCKDYVLHVGEQECLAIRALQKYIDRRKKQGVNIFMMENGVAVPISPQQQNKRLKLRIGN